MGSLVYRDEPLGLIPPPPGVVPNFVDPPSRQVEFMAATGTLFAITMILFFLRMYARIFIRRSLGWDDYMSVSGAIFVVGTFVANMFMVHHGMGVHAWDLPVTAHPRKGVIWSWTWSYANYMAAISTIKLSVLLLYFRIFATSIGKRLRNSLWTIFGLVIATLIAGEVTHFIRCRPKPLPHADDIYVKCYPLCKHVAGISVVNIVTDLMIVVVPLRTIWHLQLPTRRKIMVMALLSTGLFVCAVTVVRLTLTKWEGSQDFTWEMLDGSMWMTVEIMVALGCSCVPALQPLWRQARGKATTAHTSHKQWSTSAPMSGPRSKRFSRAIGGGGGGGGAVTETELEEGYLKPMRSDSEIEGAMYGNAKVSSEGASFDMPSDVAGNGGIIKTVSVDISSGAERNDSVVVVVDDKGHHGGSGRVSPPKWKTPTGFSR